MLRPFILVQVTDDKLRQQSPLYRHCRCRIWPMSPKPQMPKSGLSSPNLFNNLEMGRALSIGLRGRLISFVSDAASWRSTSIACISDLAFCSLASPPRPGILRCRPPPRRPSPFGRTLLPDPFGPGCRIWSLPRFRPEEMPRCREADGARAGCQQTDHRMVVDHGQPARKHQSPRANHQNSERPVHLAP